MLIYGANLVAWVAIIGILWVSARAVIPESRRFAVDRTNPREILDGVSVVLALLVAAAYTGGDLPAIVHWG